MIAYETLCQAIVDWKAGARPSASSAAMSMESVQHGSEGQPQAVEELESGVMEMDEGGEQAAYSGEHEQAAYSGEHEQAAYSGEHAQAAYAGEHEHGTPEESPEGADEYEDYDVAVEDDEERT